MLRRVLLLIVAILALAAPAAVYAAYRGVAPSDDAAAAGPVAVSAADRAVVFGAVSEEAAMVLAGMAMLSAAAIVRRTA